MLSTPLFFTTKIIHGAGQNHIYAEILQKIKLSNLNQYCMDLLQTFSPDQNLTILGEIKSSEAGYKVANCLVFNGNLIDLIINYSTTKVLIKILTIQILEHSLGSITQVFLYTEKILGWRTASMRKSVKNEKGVDL